MKNFFELAMDKKIEGKFKLLRNQ